MRCPNCGKSGDEDDFDVLGACNDNVFCTDCHTEFDPDTGNLDRCDTGARDAAHDRESGIVCKGKD